MVTHTKESVITKVKLSNKQRYLDLLTDVTSHYI